MPVDEAAAFGFFQLIAARYEYRPTILTTNQPFSKWPDVFGDAVIANAIIDRLVHHCDIAKITGHSYRIKGRNKLTEEAITAVFSQDEKKSESEVKFTVSKKLFIRCPELLNDNSKLQMLFLEFIKEYIERQAS